MEDIPRHNPGEMAHQDWLRHTGQIRRRRPTCIETIGIVFFLLIAVLYFVSDKGENARKRSSATGYNEHRKSIISTYPAWVDGDNVNIRSGPGTKYDIIRSVPRNTRVSVRNIENGWAKLVLAEKRTGWISAEYLRRSNGLADGWYFTKKGFPAAATKHMLDRATKIIVSGDMAALEKLINDGYVIIMSGGTEVFIEETDGLFGPIRIRPKGATASLWADYAAVER